MSATSASVPACRTYVDDDHEYTAFDQELMDLCKCGDHNSAPTAEAVWSAVQDPAKYTEREQRIATFLDTLKTNEERTAMLDKIGDDCNFFANGLQYILFAFAYLVKQGGSVARNVGMMARVIEYFGEDEFAVSWYMFLINRGFEFNELTKDEVDRIRYVVKYSDVHSLVARAVMPKLVPLVLKYNIQPEFESELDEAAYKYVNIEVREVFNKDKVLFEQLDSLALRELPAFIRAVHKELVRREQGQARVV